jgi:hypothetical protein
MRIFGILLLALAAGCAQVKQAPPSVTSAKMEPLMVDPSLIGPGRAGMKESGTKEPGTEEKAAVLATPIRPEAKEQAAIALAPPATGPREPAASGDKAIGTQPVAGATAPPTPSSKSPVAPRTAVPPAKVSASPAASAQQRKNEEPLPAARAPEPPLDVAALKARLRDTDAIGVFTKLALSNQVDDLLKQFRQHHQGGNKAGVAALREPYNILVLKVLALVQDTDPALARTLLASREAIWSILADPEKFNSVT